MNMKRRSFLKAMLLAPLAPLLARLPAAAAPARVIGWDPAAEGSELVLVEVFTRNYDRMVLEAVAGRPFRRRQQTGLKSKGTGDGGFSHHAR